MTMNEWIVLSLWSWSWLALWTSNFLFFPWMEVASSRGARLLKNIAEGQHSFTQRLQAHHPWHTVDLMERVYPVPLWPSSRLWKCQSLSRQIHMILWIYTTKQYDSYKWRTRKQNTTYDNSFFDRLIFTDSWTRGDLFRLGVAGRLLMLFLCLPQLELGSGSLLLSVPPSAYCSSTNAHRSPLEAPTTWL